MSELSGLANTRYSRALYWVGPSLLCLALYWYGLKTWFGYDDFVWLGLRANVHGPRDLWLALFSPAEHGTFRPLSERGFFLLFHELFGLDALPYRIWVFLTFFADLILLSSICSRLTGSRVAGFLAPILWFANGAMFTVMCWTSAYMQALCGFFLLLAFHFLLRFAETGKPRYYWFQWAAFLIGFGAMETNLVYPALAAAFAIFRAPRLLPKIGPLFVPSALFVAAHMMLAPKQAAGPYSIHFDAAIPGTLWSYWKIALASPWGAAPLAIWTAALLGFAGYRTWKKQYLPLMFLCWFLFLLAPVLPLREHVMPYYLTLPLAALSMLAAYAVACAWRNPVAWKAGAAALMLAYLAAEVPAARASSLWFYGRTREARKIVMGVERAHELHPGKLILLSGVDNSLFWAAICDRPFDALGISGVYLEPGTRLEGGPLPPDLESYKLPPAVALHALDSQQAEVYDVMKPRLENITEKYTKLAESTFQLENPRRVDAGSAAASYLLGTGWYPADEAHRWMGRRATLKIGGPESREMRLHVTGFCTPVQLEKGPLTMTIGIDGVRLPEASIRSCAAPFEFAFDLPPAAVGKRTLEVSVEVNRTTRLPDDPREFGLAFGVFSIGASSN